MIQDTGGEREPAKDFKTLEQQIDLLLQRGMSIPDENYALEVLSRISYYRLSGY